jgi:superfamily II DNA or RNA helicase
MFKQYCDAVEEPTVASILTQEPSLVIVDEAHNLKNPDSKITKSAKEIRTRRRIALTGTPLSNNLEEYWSMIDFVCPNYLGTRIQFRARFREPIEEGCYIDSTHWERKRALTHLKALERRLEPKVHRRDASVLKDTLPSLQDYIIKVQLTQEQKIAYEQYVDLFREAKGDNITTASFFQYNYDTIMLCNHPRILLEAQIARDKNKDERIDENEVVRSESGRVNRDAGLSTEQIERLRPFLDIDSLKGSFKIVAFLQIVRSAIAVHDKTLVFSQSLRTLDFLEGVLVNENIKYLRLDGRTQVTKRPDMIKDFNHQQGPNVFLISTSAGGEGSNLHGANRVIIFDFRFNPSKEEQAIGRAYRLGQTKPVHVYRIITDGTSESHLLNLVGFKTQLAVKVVERKNASNVSSRTLKEGLYKPKDVATIGHIDPKSMTTDGVLSSLIDFHNTKPFITNLETTEIYRKEEAVHLTAEDNQLIENLLQEEQTGHRPPPPPTYHSGPGVASTALELMGHAARSMMGLDMSRYSQGPQQPNQPFTMPQIPGSGIITGGFRTISSGFNHARNMVNGGFIPSSATPRLENTSSPMPPATQESYRPSNPPIPRQIRTPIFNGRPYRPSSRYDIQMSQPPLATSEQNGLGPTTNIPSSPQRNRGTNSSHLARMEDLGIHLSAPSRSKNRPSLFLPPLSPGFEEVEAPRQRHDQTTRTSNMDTRISDDMANAPIGDQHRITPAERRPKSRYGEKLEKPAGPEKEKDPEGTCKPM